MDQSKTERQRHLTKVIGTPAGRLYVLSEYKRAAGITENDAPPLTMPFSVMIEQILNREFPG
jgi:hypothetical protein